MTLTRALPRLSSTLLVAALAATALPGCVPVLLGGAIVGTSMVTIDRRSSGTQLDDQSIEIKGLRRVNDTLGDRGNVSVTSYNKVVLLTGTVRAETDRTAVARAVGLIDGVKSVVDEVAVGPDASFGTRSNDTLLTSKVKASMVDAKDIQANAFKVVTDRGIVYLMGRVTEREADRATQIARGVSGVQKVVRVFEVVTEAELADLATKPAAPTQGKP